MLKRSTIAGLVIAGLFVIYGAGSATVVKQGQESALTGEVAFDPNTVVNKFWANEASGYFSEKAVDLQTLISESGGNFATVGSKYGRYSMGDKGELSFVIKGTGVVEEVKDKLRNGYLALKPDGVDGDYKVRIQIGPVYKGTAVRDSVSKISFGDYTNQIEWANISIAFHTLIQKDIVDPVKPSELLGKKLEYTGCFSVEANPKLLRVTPVALKVVE